jgi:hypothetical protein
VTPRATIINEILSRYAELTERGGLNGSSSDGGLTIQMPPTYTADVKEVERLMGVLREKDRRLWWHLSEKYLRSSETIKTSTERRKVKGKGYITVHLRKVVPHHSPRLDEKLVEDGLEKMASWWSLQHEPFLPRQVVVG